MVSQMLVTDVGDEMCWKSFYINVGHQHSKDITNIEISSPTSTNYLTNFKSPTSRFHQHHCHLLDLGWNLSPTSEIATSNFLPLAIHNDVDLIFGDTLRSWNTSLWLWDEGCWWRKSPNMSSISPTGHLKNKK